MLGKLNEKLGGWKRETPFVQHDTHAAYQISCVEKEKDIEQVHVCLAFPGLTREHPQKYALAIFNTLFGGGMSSRLFQKIREENGPIPSTAIRLPLRIRVFSRFARA